MNAPENLIVTTPDAALSERLALIAAEAGATVTRSPAITHLIDLYWTSEEEGMRPLFTVLLRADDSALLVHSSPDGGNAAASNATFRLLGSLHIPVEAITVDVGRQKPGYPLMPVSVDGLYPEAKSLGPLLANPVFVRWMKSMKSRFVDPDSV